MKKLIIVKKTLAFMTCSALATGIVTGYPTNHDSHNNNVSAKSIAEIQEERKANEAKIAEYETQITALEGNKSSQKSYQEALAEQIYLIQQNITLLNDELDKLSSEIETTQANINHLDSDIGIQQELINSNIELFKQRLCTMYVSGNENLASVVLGSASFYDIMSRVEMVNRMASYDEELINKLVDEIEQLEKSKKDLETEKLSLESKLTEQETKRNEKADEINQLNDKMQNTQEIIDRINMEQQKINLSKEETQNYLDMLDEEEAFIQAEIQRHAEEAQRRFEEEQEKARQEAERREAERLEAERQEASREAERQEQASREQESIEIASREEASREIERQEASREIERLEEASREAERQEASREVERQEASREVERQEASREVERQEASREVERQEASREVERQEASREVERQEASREVERQEASRQAELEAMQTTVAETAVTYAETAETETTVVYNEDSDGDSDVSESETTATQTTVSETSTSTTTTTTASTKAQPSPSGFAWPAPGFYYISSPFAQRWGTQHKGIDIGDAGIMGGNVCASKAGLVTFVSNTCTHNYAKSSSCGCGGGYGNYVIIQHDGTYTTLYGHMTSVNVSVGDYVQQGDVIGTVGSTGWSTGAHLHFEVRVNGVHQNPMNYVNP